jgi:hypothetical protein
VLTYAGLLVVLGAYSGVQTSNIEYAGEVFVDTSVQGKISVTVQWYEWVVTGNISKRIPRQTVLSYNTTESSVLQISDVERSVLQVKD